MPDAADAPQPGTDGPSDASTLPCSADATPRAKTGRGGLWRLILFVAVVAALFGLARVLNLGARLGDLRQWIAAQGAWGPVLFVLVYIGATVLAAPGTPLTVGAAALFGSVLGVALVSVASTLGAALCFLIARYLARDSIAASLARNEKFRRLDSMTELHGATNVAVTRLVPLFPFNLLNYGFGLTRVRFRTYLLWSWVCMLPGTILYVVGADALFSGLEKGRVPWALLGVLTVVIVLLVFIVRAARRKLRAKDGGPMTEADDGEDCCS